MVEYTRQPQVNVAFPLTYTYTLTYTREKHCRQLLHLDHPFLTLPASGRFWELRRINQTWQCASSHLGVCFENNIANGHVLDLFSTETFEIHQAISRFPKFWTAGITNYVCVEMKRKELHFNNKITKNKQDETKRKNTDYGKKLLK